MSSLKRRLTAATLAVSATLLLLPAAGQAAQVFGNSLKNQPTKNNCHEIGVCTIASLVEPEPNNPSAAGAPIDGVITQFKIRYVADAPAPLTFLLADVSRPNPAEEDHAVATVGAAGPSLTLAATGAEGATVAVPARVAVKKGQHIAINAGDISAVYDGGGENYSYVFSPALAAGATAASPTATGQLLVQATVEADADNDGFGDETQDQCPTQATTQGPCDLTAPAVTGLKVSGSGISYSLSEPAGVSFQLGKAETGRRIGKRCVAKTHKNAAKPRCPRLVLVGKPFAGTGTVGANQVKGPRRKLGAGVYTLTMTATDAAGNATTRTAHFVVKVVVKPKHKK
jgi:hypothetical protein